MSIFVLVGKAQSGIYNQDQKGIGILQNRSAAILFLFYARSRVRTVEVFE